MGLLTATTTKLSRHSSLQSTHDNTLQVLLRLNPFNLTSLPRSGRHEIAQELEAPHLSVEEDAVGVRTIDAEDHWPLSMD